MTYMKKITTIGLTFSAVFIVGATLLSTFTTPSWDCANIISAFMPIPITIFLAYAGKAGAENVKKIAQSVTDNTTIHKVAEVLDKKIKEQGEG